MTARPDDTPYDAADDASRCYLEWVDWMREQHLRESALRDAPDGE